MRLILIFLVLFSLDLKSQVKINNCDYSDRVQTFYVDQNPGSTYYWSVSAGDIVTQDNNKITILFPDKTGQYVLSLIEVGENGCPGDERKLLIEILPCEEEVIWIPSAFTPNGDGRNDIFMIFGNVKSKDFTFEIYNRWGELIFLSQDPKLGWDGRYKGKFVQDDLYLYKLQCRVNSKIFVKNGTITLIK
jgi:gliding motility-associated-like protein